MAGPGLSTSRSTSNTAADHAADHNAAHQAINDIYTKFAFAQDYGVVGNGTIDDTTAFQTFLSTATTARMEAQLKSGSTVKLTSAVTPPTGCRLDLNGATIKNAAAGVNDRLITLSGVTEVSIRNGTLDGDKASFAPTTEQRHNLY